MLFLITQLQLQLKYRFGPKTGLNPRLLLFVQQFPHAGKDLPVPHFFQKADGLPQKVFERQAGSGLDNRLVAGVYPNLLTERIFR